jgi:dihydrofolate reductase
MLIRTHVGISLDGFLATPDGRPTWDAIPTFDGTSHGHDDFTALIDAVVIGRSSFDQAAAEWLVNSPWPGKPVYVLTSQPLPTGSSDAGFIASQGGPAGLVKQLREANLARDVQVLGGSRTIQAFLELGAIDRLGIVVLPILLGKGIPLFAIDPAPFSKQAWDAHLASPSASPARPLLRLDHQRQYRDGSVELVYQS